MKSNNLNTFTFTSVKLLQEKHNKKRSKYSKFGQQHNTKTDVAGLGYIYPSYFILQILENFRNCVFYVRDSFSSILGRIFEDPKEEIRSRKSKMNKLGICDKKKQNLDNNTTQKQM
jgi:hypothetical protein